MASPPLYMTPVPQADVERGDGALVCEFIERYCRVTKESLGGKAGTLLQLRNWQKNLISCIYARRPDNRRRHRLSLTGLPRKQGKSALGSAIGLHGLIMGDYGSEVYSCAVDRDQARVVFSVAKRMVELDPEMSALIKPYRDVLEYTEKGSIYKVLSSEAVTKEGLSPNLVIYDELHGAPDPELFDVMALAMGSRIDPMLVAITTAGQKTDRSGQDSTCYKLYQQGVRICKGEVDDPSFFMAWFGVPQNADYKDPAVWAQANPGFGDLIDPEDFASVIKRVHENEFRALDVATPLLTANRGWVTMGTVRVGDIVFAGDGAPTRVAGVSNTFTGRDCYEVEFDDRCKIVADAQHEWNVLDVRSGGALKKAKRITVTTTDLLTRKSLRLGVTTKLPRKRYLATTKPLQIAPSDLPIDPYWFGLWLGDGSKNEPAISAHADDVSHILEQTDAAGYYSTVHHRPTKEVVYSSCSRITYRKTERQHFCEVCGGEYEPGQWRQRTCGRGCGAILRKQPNYAPTDRTVVPKDTLLCRLRNLGVLNNKHIPGHYLIASASQRLALLQGLMDTDGGVISGGRVRFSNTNRDLIDGVLFLARSFGWLARERRRAETGHAPAWDVSWTMPDETPPFRMKRKMALVNVSAGHARVTARKVTRVTKVDSRPTRCLSVEHPSHMFLAGNDLVISTNTKRLDQFVSAARAWLPQGAWDRCRTDRDFTPGKRGVVLGFDGSQNGDTTALVAVTITADPQVIVLGLWEKPQDAEDEWRVPRGEVKDRIRQACHDYHVREVAADEYIWQDSLEELEAEGIPIVVFPQTLTRMAPATQRMYEYVANQAISHDGNPALARHFDNCVLKTDSRGSRLIKDAKGSPRKIDLAVATVMAVDRAGFWLNEPLEGTIDGRLISDIQFVWDDGPGSGGSVSIGECCARCGNKIVRELKRVGIQVVCAVPCGKPSEKTADDAAPKDDGFYHGYLVS